MEHCYQATPPYSLIKIHFSISTYEQVLLEPSKHQALEATGWQDENSLEVIALTVQEQEEITEGM